MSIKAGVIGCGGIGTHRAKSLFRLDDVDIVGIADQDEHRAAILSKQIGEVPTFSDYSRLLNMSLDVVFVAIPNNDHYTMLRDVVSRKLNFFVEYPLCLQINEAEDIVEAVEKSDLVAEVGYNRRHHLPVELAYSAFKKGEIGDPVWCCFDGLKCSRYTGHWFEKQARSGGMFLGWLVDAINILRWFLGKPIRISAEWAQLVHKEKGLIEDETNIASLKFANGTLGSIYASFVAPPNFPRTIIKVIGSKGGIGQREDEVTIYNKDGRTTVGPSPESTLAESYYRQVKDFMRCLKTGEKPRTGIKEAFEDVKIALAGVRAAKTGKTQTLS